VTWFITFLVEVISAEPVRAGGMMNQSGPIIDTPQQAPPIASFDRAGRLGNCLPSEVDAFATPGELTAVETGVSRTQPQAAARYRTGDGRVVAQLCVAVAFLTSEDARWVTGQSIRADGGIRPSGSGSGDRVGSK